MVLNVWEITIQLNNGDWLWDRIDRNKYDFHRAVIFGLDFAYRREGKLVRIEKLDITGV